MMIEFTDPSVTIYLNYKPYSAIADLHTSQFTAAHPLGFSVSITRRTSSQHRNYHFKSLEVFLSFLLQTPRNAVPILQL
jgi:hypothetical protein